MYATRGCKAIVVRALYGLKYAGASFQSHLADCIRQLRFKYNKTDPGLWMKVCTGEVDNNYGPKIPLLHTNKCRLLNM